MTFSLLGRCGRTGELGIVVASSSPAVGARCAFVRAGVGAAASQNVTDPRLGTALLERLERGERAEDALAAVVVAAPHADHRQLAVVDRDGRAGAWSGPRALGIHGDRAQQDCAAAGNLLAHARVLDALVARFAAEPEAGLGDRLVAALRAGLDAGGELGPVHSAGMLIAAEVPWPVADLRVDWDERPVERLAELWERYRLQLDDYVTRALDPDAAPAYGVPGEVAR